MASCPLNECYNFHGKFPLNYGNKNVSQSKTIQFTKQNEYPIRREKQTAIVAVTME